MIITVAIVLASLVGVIAIIARRSQAPETEEFWFCRKCHYPNGGDETTCVACGAERDENE